MANRLKDNNKYKRLNIQIKREKVGVKREKGRRKSIEEENKC